MVKNKELVLTLIGQIDHLMKALEATMEEARVKVNEFKQLQPSSFDLRGLGSLLHDFFTTIEDIFEQISADVNGSLPDTPEWHKQLLIRMSIPIPGLRPAVISEELRWELDEYLWFRHLFRNVYGYLLDWKRLKPLFGRMEDTYQQFSHEVNIFRTFMLQLAEQLD